MNKDLLFPVSFVKKVFQSLAKFPAATDREEQAIKNNFWSKVLQLLAQFLHTYDTVLQTRVNPVTVPSLEMQEKIRGTSIRNCRRRVRSGWLSPNLTQRKN